LAPGFKTFHCATLGYFFEIEIVIQEPSGGGLKGYDTKDSRRQVIVSVRFKNYTWRQSLMIETIVLDRLEVIISKIRVIPKETIRVMVSLKQTIKDMFVRVTQINK
jgi:hypothetical protein